MKLTKFFFPAIAFMVAATSLASCSDNDEPEKPADPDKGDVYVMPVDELAELQDALVKTDKDGNLVSRITGVSLDAANPDEVSVGVESYEDAVSTFGSLFADTTVISDNGTYARFSVQKGSARLTKASGKDGLVAYADFDVEGLKYVSRINFILNSAWPDNAGAKGFHKLGVQYEYKAWTGAPTPAATDWFDQDELYTFVCVREYQNGKPALLVGISPRTYYLYWRYADQYAGNMPGKNKATEISNILRSNWEYYKSVFNANDKNLLNDGWEYWIHSGHEYVFEVTRDAIRLDNGKIDWYDVHWKEPKKSVLFFLEAGQKG